MPGRHLAARQLPRTPAQPTSVSRYLISRDPGAGLPQAALSHTPKNRKVQIPSDLVVAHWPSEVESTAPLDFLLRHGLWTPFGYPMSCKIRSIISATCDFTTKSDGIW